MPALRVPVDLDPRHCQLLGLVGSVVLASGGASAGALPVREALALKSDSAAIGLVAVYFGLVLLIAAWLLLGRAVRGPEPPTRRTLLITLVLWSAPLLVTPPLFSRDVYSYLAQGAMVDAHMDVYVQGPAQLGGPLTAEVPVIWQNTPTPYGPVFLAFASAITDPSRPDGDFGLFGLRIVALLGVSLMVLCLPRLARHCGADERAALWLGALNPLLLLHLVGGAHNDAVMLGLLAAGLVSALGRRPAVGAVLVTLAALVKAPAALGLVAVAMLWCRRLETRREQAMAVAATVGSAAATTALTTALTGTGYGWISALTTPAFPGNWSVTNLLARLTADLLEHTTSSGLAPLAGPLWHALGLLGTAVTVLIVWRRRRTLGPVYSLGLCLMALAVLGPALRPWYVLWGLFLIAAAAPQGHARRLLTLTSGILALAVLPSGFAADTRQLALATSGGVLALAVLICTHVASAPSNPSGTSNSSGTSNHADRPNPSKSRQGLLGRTA